MLAKIKKYAMIFKKCGCYYGFVSKFMESNKG